MLRPFAHPVACCCAKFETGQSFQSTIPNISFVPWSPKGSATMLDSFPQLFQHCWGRARSLRVVYKDFPRCTAGLKLVGSCCIRLHTTANTQAITPNIFGATMLGVVAPVCTQPNNAFEICKNASYCCARKYETWRQYPWIMRAVTCKQKFTKFLVKF